jgi:membrane protease YdiL (CAAX protease family)
MPSAVRGPLLPREKRSPQFSGPLGLIRNHPITAIVVLTFGLTWLLSIPMVLDARGQLPFPFPFPLIIVMGWMPGAAAVIVAAATGGRAAVRTLFGRLLIWRVGWRWYLLVSVGSAAMWLGAVALNPLFGGVGLQIPEFSVDLLIGLVINFVLLFLVNAEELVWRGSMLPRLQRHRSALAASVIIGAFEGLFHLPLFFQPNSDQAAAGLPVFVLGSIAGAIIFSWLFNNTMGSLLLVQLFHIFANTWITLFAASPADNVISQWLFNGVLVLVAAIVLLVSGARRLSAASPSQASQGERPVLSPVPAGRAS